MSTDNERGFLKCVCVCVYVCVCVETYTDSSLRAPSGTTINVAYIVRVNAKSYAASQALMTVTWTNTGTESDSNITLQSIAIVPVN